MSEITTISHKLGQQLLAKNWTVTTAESCTGGGIAMAITEVAGSSGYFDCAFVTYSNEMKSKLVNVSEQTLADEGAVSKAVVEQMALGAAKQASANVAIAVSGIAGPGGGTDLKPVGTVWMAIYCIDTKVSEKTTVWSQCFLFDGDRKSIREQTVEAALNKALELVSENI